MTNSINCLQMNLTNEYGSGYGTEYIFFPEVSYSEYELREKIKALTNRIYSNLYKSPLAFFCNTQLNAIQVSHDVWSQNHTSEVFNIDEAIIKYFNE